MFRCVYTCGFGAPAVDGFSCHGCLVRLCAALLFTAALVRKLRVFLVRFMARPSLDPVSFLCFLSAIRRRRWISTNRELTGAWAAWARLRSALMWAWRRGDAALGPFVAAAPDSARSLCLRLKPAEPIERTQRLTAARYSSSTSAPGNLQCRRPGFYEPSL